MHALLLHAQFFCSCNKEIPAIFGSKVGLIDADAVQTNRSESQIAMEVFQSNEEINRPPNSTFDDSPNTEEDSTFRIQDGVSNLGFQDDSMAPVEC